MDVRPVDSRRSGFGKTRNRTARQVVFMKKIYEGLREDQSTNSVHVIHMYTSVRNEDFNEYRPSYLHVFKMHITALPAGVWVKRCSGVCVCVGVGAWV